MATRALVIFPVLVLALGCSRSSERRTPPPLDPRDISPLRAVAVAAGTSHSCALLSHGQVDCWGSNDRGQLGARADETCVVEDVLHNMMPARRTPCRGAPAAVEALNDAIQITAGGSTTCALRSSGTVSCWGANDLGLLGDGTTTDRQTPSEVKGLAKVTQISMSATHACARFENGQVACWGENFFGELGTPPKDPGADVVSRQGYGAVKELAPVRVPGLDHVEEVGVGERLTCARRTSGEVSCFGQFAQGLLGNPTPTAVPALAGVSTLALGVGSHGALDSSGALRGWGSNGSTQLQDGTREARKEPVSAQGLPPLSRVAWSAVRGCGVAGSGDVFCWGQDGRGGIDPPRKVPLPMTASAIAQGANHACVVAADGSVWCWGDGFYGETGARNGKPLPTSAFWTPPRKAR